MNSRTIVSFVAAPDGTWFFCVWAVRESIARVPPVAWGNKRTAAQAKRAAADAARFHHLSTEQEEDPDLARMLLPQLLAWQRARQGARTSEHEKRPTQAHDPRRCFELLGVSKHCTRNDLVIAWRKIARETHPDSPGGSDAKFIAAREAYEQALALVTSR